MEPKTGWEGGGGRGCQVYLIVTKSKTKSKSLILPTLPHQTINLDRPLKTKIEKFWSKLGKLDSQEICEESDISEDVK